MTSQLFWSFLVLALVTEASSWSTRRRSSSCVMPRNCRVSSWSSWSACSQPCGTGGMQNRKRTVTRYPLCGGSPCRKLMVTRSCNQGKCANGGTPNIEGCNCRQEFSGQCCLQTEVYKTIGCYNDSLDRAIPTLEETDYILDGDFWTRNDPIYKCYEVAKKLGFKVFALQAGGWCASSSTAEKTFNKYGMSSNCENDGEGGPYANQAYYIKDYTGVGCYRDTTDRAIPTLEDTDSVLDGGVFFYRSRQNAIVKCAVAARRRGFPAFALQDGGWCAASANVLETFNKYGKSSDCNNKGTGGPFANNVYVFQDEINTVRVSDPIAFYPLNTKYTTREIKNRQAQGNPVGVSMAPGPDGKAGGSYQFTGQSNSYIEFPNNGGLDAQHSITMLCWVYPENTDGPIFNYKITGGPWAVHFWMHSGKLYGVISQRNYLMIPGLRTFHVLALNQWHYVGFTYSHITGMANLWLDDQRVVHRNIGAGLSLSTQDNVRMGALENDGRYFKGRITAMQIYDVALTEEQINAVENAGQGNDRCSEMGWESALSGPGWANCSLGRYISGVWRENDAVISLPDGIDNIKKGQCCSPPHEYKDDTPVCQTLDWKTSLSRNNRWASCPGGYFLQGIYRSNETWLHNIEKALCCRPRNFKNMTKDCYDENVRKSLNKKGWSKCRDWHYMMGLDTALLKDYTGVGCYRDTTDRAIPTLEDTDSVLDGGVFFYRSRQNAIVKCAVAARRRGFPAFALQDGGWCAASANVLETFNKYGKSSDCNNKGTGGPFANNVYVFQDEINTVRVSDPIAFYPLNTKYTTREIKNRQAQGNPVGVSMAPGPDGKAGGSYQFTGQSNSYIEFPNNGGLDAQHSITMLCWVYPENTDGPIFNYKITGGPWAVHFWMHSGKLYGVISQRNYLMIPGLRTFHVLALNQWHYVGFTYSHITGMANLWLDDQRVVHRNIGAGLSLSTQDNVRMGALENDGRYFKGRITAMQIYDVALTEEQINAVENAGQGNDRCSEMGWESALRGPGWANCSLGRYISGVWRENDAVISLPDGIDNIKKGQCCSSPHEYKDDTPVCQTLDWKTSLSRNNRWASCPDGYFLQGIYRSTETWLHNIEKALCCRPRNFKNFTKNCYDENVRKSLNKKGWSKCRDWHYMMGVYKGDCDNLNCIDMIKCCRMTPPGTHSHGLSDH
ncbi:uncharacterized protein LOC110064194 [Orbicella faveolata]|uniref:uncharacterized protein LOC110064194 n=1 Tax=Orbicella faveolata TaxID=48498 RepID=UPI0009E537E4|nr:uncharacterized protein LOC110064194 [Orbicella faveolata]